MATILVVDDEEVVRITFVALLGQAGYEVITAADGEEAYQRALQKKPNLVIMDLNLGVTDGLSAARKIRRIHGYEEVPVVIYTGRDDIPEKRREELRQEFGAFLIKPAENEIIMSNVASLLKNEKK